MIFDNGDIKKPQLQTELYSNVTFLHWGFSLTTQKTLKQTDLKAIESCPSYGSTKKPIEISGRGEMKTRKEKEIVKQTKKRKKPSDSAASCLSKRKYSDDDISVECNSDSDPDYSSDE